VTITTPIPRGSGITFFEFVPEKMNFQDFATMDKDQIFDVVLLDSVPRVKLV